MVMHVPMIATNVDWIVKQTNNNKKPGNFSVKFATTRRIIIPIENVAPENLLFQRLMEENRFLFSMIFCILLSF